MIDFMAGFEFFFYKNNDDLWLLHLDCVRSSSVCFIYTSGKTAKLKYD